jgi:hypothetical protein
MWLDRERRDVPLLDRGAGVGHEQRDQLDTAPAVRDREAFSHVRREETVVGMLDRIRRKVRTRRVLARGRMSDTPDRALKVYVGARPGRGQPGARSTREGPS